VYPTAEHYVLVVQHTSGPIESPIASELDETVFKVRFMHFFRALSDILNVSLHLYLGLSSAILFLSVPLGHSFDLMYFPMGCFLNQAISASTVDALPVTAGAFQSSERSDWFSGAPREAALLVAARAKFTQHSDLGAELKATGEKKVRAPNAVAAETN